LLRAKIQLCIGDRGAAEKTFQRLTARPGLHHPDFHEQAASVEMALHLQPKAVKALESLKSKYPSRSTTLLLLAKGYVDSDEPEKAVAELMAVGSESRTACWYRLHAEALLQQEKQSDALATVEMGLRKSPDALSLRITKVKALLAAGNEGKARALSGRLYRAHPQDVSVLLAASEALRASGKLVRAEARLKAALEHDPENPKAHAALGRLLAQMGKWDRAAVHLKRAASIHSSSVRNWLELGKLAYRQGRLHAAVDPIKEVLKKSPDHPQALTLLAKVNVATGRFQRARFLLKKVVPKKRGPHWHLVYGWLLLRQADYAEADRHIATAAKRNSPVRRKGVVLQARSALFQDQLRRMRSVLERVGSKWRSHPEVRFSWGLYWLAEHKARTAFRRFVAARRSCRRWKCPPRLEAVIRAYLGRALFLRGSTSAAIRQFNRALEVDPYCAPAYALQGACFYELEKEQRALDLFHKALKLDKGLAETHYYLGEIYRSKGSKKKAADHFRTYLKLRGFGELASAARAGLQAVQ
jgi:tetratricopeptide (TPR) repeat protein